MDMLPWNFSAGDPLSFILAADARLTETNYADDQVWELRLGGGEPQTLALQTTYGLRAHWMRLFPRFVRGESARVDPNAFHQPPKLLAVYPNSLALVCQPYEGLEVVLEYRAVASHLVTGRIKIANRSILPQNFRLEWAALLNPIDRQGCMEPAPAGASSVLHGETSYLHPVVALTGGPQPVTSPYPALSLELEMLPNNERQFSWAVASLRDFESSLEAARGGTARPWEAEQAGLEMLNFSQTVRIETGDPSWDAALALSQKTAFELLQNHSGLPNLSFVLARRPDLGFSPRGDGNDYPYLWSGQTGMDALYMASLLAPGEPALAAGLLRNFLAVQEADGSIDWKPGLAGQRSRSLCQPVLCSLAARLGAYLEQPAWYAEVFPGLLRFFNAWFDPLHDRDGDGFPEWEHPVQSGLEESPIADRWSPKAQGIDISYLESPALAAMLLNECDSLIEMASALTEAEKAEAAYARLKAAQSPAPAAETEGSTPGTPDTYRAHAAEALPLLLERQTALRDALDATWDEAAATYRYRDYQTHLSPPGKPLAEFQGARKQPVRRRFKQPQRLVVHLESASERTYAAFFTIHGFNEEGEVSEKIDPRGFSWHGGIGRATTRSAFLALKRVEVIGLDAEDTVRLSTVDYTTEDCSLLLPLWCGHPNPQQASSLIRANLVPRYLQPYGISLCPTDPLPPTAEPVSGPAVEEAPAGEDISPGGDEWPADDPAPEPGLWGIETPGSMPPLPELHQPGPEVPAACRAVPLIWNQLLGEGLLRYGYRHEAAELVTRLMRASVIALQSSHTFRQHHDAYTGQPAARNGDRNPAPELPPAHRVYRRAAGKRAPAAAHPHPHHRGRATIWLWTSIITRSL
jgi:hypothetical protein